MLDVLRTKTGVFFIMAVFPMALDFKSVDGAGSLAQFFLLVVSLFGFFLLVFKYVASNEFKIRKGNHYIGMFLIVYVFFGFFVGLLNQAVPYEAFVVFLPYFFILVGLFSVKIALEFGVGLLTIFKVVFFAAFLSFIWRVFYAFFMLGLDVKSVRWYILSPSIPFLMGFSVYVVFYRKSLKVFDALVFFSVFSVLTISQTRGGLLVYLLLLFLVLYLVFSERRVYEYLKMIKSSLVITGLLTISIGLALFVKSDLLEEWVDRLLAYQRLGGIDYSAITRKAEYIGQLDIVNSSVYSILFGKGFGSHYTWDPEVMDILPAMGFVDDYFVSGHSSWIYSVFSHGYFLSILFIFFYAFAIRKAYMKFKFSRVFENSYGGTVFVFGNTLFILIAYLGWSLTGGIFGERFSGILIGSMLGIVFYSDFCCKKGVRLL